MLGNTWHASIMGMQDLARRRELGYRALMLRQFDRRSPADAHRLRAWLGNQLIRAGEALRPYDCVEAANHSARDANGIDLWRTHPSRI